MKSAVPTHKKTSRLMRRLGICRAHAVGILEMLWNYAKQQAKDGWLRDFNADDAGDILGVDDGGVVMMALVETGWLRRHPQGVGYIVNDWLDHCEPWVIQELKRAGRLPGGWERSDGSPDGFYVCDESTDSYRNLLRTPHPSEESKENKSEGLERGPGETATAAKVRKPSPPDMPEVREPPAKTTVCTEGQAKSIYDLYPKHEGRRAAIKAIQSAAVRLANAGNTDPLAYLQDAVMAYRDSPRVKNGDRKFIPHPATWFNEERYDDDRTEWAVAAGAAAARTQAQGGVQAGRSPARVGSDPGTYAGIGTTVGLANGAEARPEVSRPGA